MKTIPLVLTLLAALTLGACASSRSGDVYSRDEARQEMIVRTGVVESVRDTVHVRGVQGDLWAHGRDLP